jgi:hypothetical protein
VVLFERGTVRTGEEVDSWRLKVEKEEKNTGWVGVDDWASLGAAVLRPYMIEANGWVWAGLDLNPHP